MADALPAVESLLESEAGLATGELRRASLAAAIGETAARGRIADVSSYLAKVGADPALLEELVAAVSVGESYFLRDADHFRLLTEEIVPDLVARHGSGFRVWSAGCASGEEAYSLAIALIEAGVMSPWPILGTDISRRALRRAEEGVYGEWSFRGVPDDVRQRWFDRAGSRWTVRPELRRSVRFEHLNLVAHDYPSLWSGVSGMHVVLCRNVLIYMHASAIAQVAQRLHDSLADGGWLITGASDPPLDDLAPFRSRIVAGRVVYRRAEADAVPPMPEPHATPKPHLDSPTRRIPVPAAGDAVAEIRSLADAGHHADARRLVDAALRQAPRDAELHYVHAAVLLEQGDDLAAATAARRALRLRPDLAVAYIVLGSALRREGDRSGAEQAYRSAAASLSGVSEYSAVPLGDGETAGGLRRTVETLIALAGGW